MCTYAWVANHGVHDIGQHNFQSLMQFDAIAERPLVSQVHEVRSDSGWQMQLGGVRKARLGNCAHPLIGTTWTD